MQHHLQLGSFQNITIINTTNLATVKTFGVVPKLTKTPHKLEVLKGRASTLREGY
jgi:hypothetical protein